MLPVLSGVTFVALLGAFVILLAAPILATKLGVLDIPNSARKRHALPTPLIGGIAIMVPFVFWAGAMQIAGEEGGSRLLLAILLCSAGASLVGFADDQSPTSPTSRFLSLLLLTITALIIDPSLLPKNIEWGSFAATPLEPVLAYILTAVAMTGFVNAVNMSDGQNGLVLGQYVIWSICLMLLGHQQGRDIAQFLLETSVVVLLFNLRGKVFLGDAGTYGVTFIFGLMAIYAHNNWGVRAETVMVWFFIPVMDCLRLIIARMLKGHAPFSPDRNHFHHHLEDKLGKTQGLCIYLGAVGGTSLVSSMVPHLSLVCMVILTAFYFSFAWLAEEKSVAAEEGSPDGNVVNFGMKDVNGNSR